MTGLSKAKVTGIMSLMGNSKLQALLKNLDENAEKDDREIYIGLSLNGVSEKFLYKTKSTRRKFGYQLIIPRYKFFNEMVASMEEQYLRNAKCYFSERLNEILAEQGIVGLENINTTPTERFLFNDVIKDEFDVFVAFETMPS